MTRGALDLRSGESSVRGSRGYAIPHGACSNRNARPASVTRRSRQSKPDQEDRLGTTEMTASTQSPGLPTRFYTWPQIRFGGLNACQTSTSRMLRFSAEATCRHNYEGEWRARAIRWRGIPVRWSVRFSRADGGASPRVHAGGPSMLKGGSHNIGTRPRSNLAFTPTALSLRRFSAPRPARSGSPKTPYKHDQKE